MEWKNIDRLNGLYQVSDTGLIRKTKTNKIMKLSFNEKGYQIVRPIINGKRYTFRVHRLVAQAFIPNPLNKPQINHKNGVKTDNRVENLEWNTQEENYAHALTNGLVFKSSQKCALLYKGIEIMRFNSVHQAQLQTKDS